MGNACIIPSGALAGYEPLRDASCRPRRDAAAAEHDLDGCDCSTSEPPPFLELLLCFPDLFEAEVLARLDPTDRAVLGQVGRPWLAAVVAAAAAAPRVRPELGCMESSKNNAEVAAGVGARVGDSPDMQGVPRAGAAQARIISNGTVASVGYDMPRAWKHGYTKDKLSGSNMPCAGKSAGFPLKLKDFVGSVERLAWAAVNGCPWVAKTCAVIARSGNMEVLQWAKEHGCPWSKSTCSQAALCGHFEVVPGIENARH